MTELHKFFHEILQEHSEKFSTVSALELNYLTNLLVRFNSPESFFVLEESELKKPTLAFLLKDALESPVNSSRSQKLSHLGDVALYTIGVMPLSLKKSLVGVDYYVSMGSQAYGSVISNPIYAKLEKNFSHLMNLLNISLAIKLQKSSLEDILEMYLITKSPGLKAILNANGIFPYLNNSLN